MNSEFTVAVHSLVFLNHKNRVTRSEDIAQNVCTHPARVRKVLSRLKKAGLVTSREGQRGGGYAFAGDPARVTLLQVLDALDERIISAGWASGDMDMECLIASGMGAIMGGIYDELDRLCRERLSQTTIADIDRQIFGDGVNGRQAFGILEKK